MFPETLYLITRTTTKNLVTTYWLNWFNKLRSKIIWKNVLIILLDEELGYKQ